MDSFEVDPKMSPLKRALIAVRDMRDKLVTAERSANEPIAIIGMACRFPGSAVTLARYWQLLEGGIDAIQPVPESRWDANSYYDLDPEAPGKMYTREGGFLNETDMFDAGFFGIAPKEAAYMDPQQRLLLEVGWEALEHAGIPSNRIKNSQCGVFVGISASEYMQQGLKQGGQDQINPYSGTGGALSVAAGRLSYFLGLHGPAISIDTACSSSLVAIDQAVLYLRSKKCNLALAGGVSFMASPESAIYLCKIKALSPDGRCKTFDISADGYGRGEGCGVIVLKRLSDAQADGDRILAVIRGSAVNHDGRSSGLTVPNGAAQQEVIQAALANAELEPSQIDYIEAHGTGTALGDPIEVRALDAVFGKKAELLVGTAKTNIGHLESAAGVAGVIKVVLALQNGMIPPHLHCNNPSPHIPWDEINIRVPRELTAWPAGIEHPIAGVSSFGFSGTNAHLILQAAPKTDRLESAIERPLHLLPLSARNEVALNQLTARYANLSRSDGAQSVADICYSAGVGRSHFQKRIALLADGHEALAERLEAYGHGEAISGLFAGEQDSGERAPKVAFVFAGQGAQYPGMGRMLYQTQPTFRKILEECDALLRPYWNHSLIDVLYPESGAEDNASQSLNQAAITQPALFALEYALAQLWRSWGIEPSLVMGYGVGDYVAACVAGVFSLQDGLKLIAAHSGLLKALPNGGRTAAGAADAQHLLNLSGGSEDTISSAAMNESQMANVEKVAAEIAFSVPQIKLINNLTGRITTGEEILQPNWWRLHGRGPVRFAESIRLLKELKVHFCLEIGTSPVLPAMGQGAIDEDVEWLPSLCPGRDDWTQMLESLAKLYVKGVVVDWSGFDRGYQRCKITLPSYPFQRDSYWIDKEVQTLQENTISAIQGDTGPHPLLGRRLRSPLIEENVFSSIISTAVLPFLRDHVVFGAIVFPATAYLEMALAAARQTSISSGCVLENMAIEEPLILQESQTRTLQLILSPEGMSGFQFKIYSSELPFPEDKENWILHALGSVRQTGEEKQIPVSGLELLDGFRQECGTEIEVEAYYRKLSNLGIDYGPGFRTIEKLWHGQGQGLGRLRLGDEMAGEVDDYHLHPAILDGCLQVLGTALMMDAQETEGKNLYLPIEFGKLTVYGGLGPQCWCHVRILNGPTVQAETITADLSVLDEQGNLVVMIEGLIAKSAERHAVQRISEKRIEEWLYQIDWQQKEREASKPPQTIEASGPWLVFSDRSRVAEEIIQRLKQANSQCIVVYPGERYQALNENQVTVNPLDPDDFRRMLEDSLSTDQAMIAGVIHLWSLDAALDHPGIESIERSHQVICAGVLHLIQAMGTRSLAPSFRFWLVTRGSQPVGTSSVTDHILQSAFFGLGRVMAIEHPELRCMRVDLDPNDDSGWAAQLNNEIQGAGNEDQIAYRDGDRYVARFVRLPTNAQKNESSLLTLPPGESYRLIIPQRGVIDKIELAETRREAPGPEQVEIRVHATGLNFRDVLNVLDMYPGDAGQLGSECVGCISAVGEGVTQYHVGEKVIALTSGSFSKYVQAPTEMLMRFPAQFSDEEAATLPIAFLTAYYGLHHLAGMKKGDRVLIHAAAGGVGMAAVQLAKMAGAEVFGTAGSPEKQQFLKTIGVDHVMHSRTLDFADEIMEITGGGGVDIVLNALAGEFIPKSLSVLGAGGRFIEIGKADIWDLARVAQVNPKAEYAAFDLAEEIMKEPKLVGVMFQHIAEGIEAKTLQPLPVHTFAIENVIDAFRFMAQARHTGKIVVTHHGGAGGNAPRESELIHSDAAYLITGGLGSLGLIVADWLVEQGARHVVLMGRSEPDEKTQEGIEALRGRGAAVSTARGDVTRAEDLKRIFNEIEAAAPPLRGIVHAAGILHDGVFMKQKWETFEKVLAPKVRGAWLLNELSRDLPLDFFILFSSSSAVLGSPGQVNYVVANAFMDGFSHYLRAHGRNSLSINWGPWSDTGMAHSLTGQNKLRVLDRGIQPIRPEQGVQVLKLLLKRRIAQATVLPVSWPKFLQTFSTDQIPVLFEALAPKAGPRPQAKRKESDRADLKQRLLAAPESDRQEMLISVVTSLVAKVMGMKSSEVLDIKTPFNSLGLDSLMAVELRNTIADAVGHSFPASLIYDYPTIKALSGHLFHELLGGEVSLSMIENSLEADIPKESVTAEIDGLSLEEMAQLLAVKIKSINHGNSE